MVMWIGTYPEAGLGTPTGLGEGLWRVSNGEAEAAIELAAPSFVVAHPDLPILYAVSEEDNSSLHALDIQQPDRVELIGSVDLGGAGACHIEISPDALTLYISFYGAGDVAVVGVGATGGFTTNALRQRISYQGTGPITDRQESSHAHSSRVVGSRLLVADLGADVIWGHEISETGRLSEPYVAVQLPAGSGPRHFDVVGENIYLVGELNHTLYTIRWVEAEGVGDVIFEQPLTPVASRSSEEHAGAHIQALDNLLLVSVRGADVISVFDLSVEGQPHYRNSFDSGHWPRHFTVATEQLWIAAERGDEVRTYDLADVLALIPEQEVAGFEELPHRLLSVPKPACVVLR